MRGRVFIALVGVLTLAVAALPGCGRKTHGDIVIGRPSITTSTSGPVVVTEPPPTSAPAVAARPGGKRDARLLLGPDGRPYGSPLVFTSGVPIPADLLFILVVGSDARPGEDLRRSHADSIHLLAVNPRTLQGTVLGFPRDSWVEIPGHGNGKLTSAMAIGGPELLSQTVRRLTGLPVHYWVLTGFTGLSNMVDELGGVDVFVERRMNDRNSGTNFEPGWHHFDGRQALSFSRDRHSVPNGDFDRSRNQAALLLAGLSKLRAEVGDDAGLQRWLDVLLRHAELDAPARQLMPLAALARRLDPASMSNVVTPGRVGTAGGQSVVFLGQEAANIFLDLRPDAVMGAAGPEQTTTTTSTSTSTTSSSTTSTTTKLPG
jgi:LCP family protein required for cell wall assembly